VAKVDPKYRKFIHHYFYGKTGIVGNAAQSAIAAGFAESTARAKAPAWVENSREQASNKTIWDMVQAERIKMENDYEITEEQILKQYKRLALFDIRKLYNSLTGEPLPIHTLDDDTAAAISGVDITYDMLGFETKKIKIIDKKYALDSLAKIKGMFAKDNAQKNPSFEEIFTALTKASPELANAVKEQILKNATE
jgi:phage terminase small subunit